MLAFMNISLSGSSVEDLVKDSRFRWGSWNGGVSEEGTRVQAEMSFPRRVVGV
jgi:hypothetical protein